MIYEIVTFAEIRATLQKFYTSITIFVLLDLQVNNSSIIVLLFTGDNKSIRSNKDTTSNMQKQT